MSPLTAKLLHPNATLPVRSTEGAAGYDLFYCAPTKHHFQPLTPGGRVILDTGVAIAIPDGYVGIIKPRSGLAVRYGIDVLAGVIDSDYRGEILVVLGMPVRTNNNETYTFHQGDRIAQLIIVPCARWDVRPVAELPETIRGDDGFGSTGV